MLHHKWYPVAAFESLLRQSIGAQRVQNARTSNRDEPVEAAAMPLTNGHDHQQYRQAEVHWPGRLIWQMVTEEVQRSEVDLVLNDECKQ